jgi:N-acetylglucosamine-6-phosphate deacetylase
MRGLHHRDVGVLGASLLRDDVWCELICDSLHVSLPMIRIILKIKDADKIIMVSDSGAYAGAPVGTYRNPGQNVKSDRGNIHVTEDGFVLSDTGRLTGSSKPVIFGIMNLVEKLGVPLEDALRFSSLNPCVKYGFAGRKGSILVGKDADFAVIGDDYRVINTYSEGRLVYDRAADTHLFNQKFVNEFKI